MKKLFPLWEDKNIRIFYILNFLSPYFALPNWMFLMLRYVTKSQVGFIDASAILFGVLLEIPTGLISDVFGKKRTLIAGNFSLALGTFIIALSTSFEGFLIGNLLTFVGFAFNSGSFEAFAYDSLVSTGQAEEYGRVVEKSTSLGIITSLLTILVGGLLFAIDPRLPFFASGLYFSLGVFVLFFATEPRIDTEHTDPGTYLSKLKDGVKTIFSLQFRDILIPVLVISALARVHQGVVRQSMAVYYSFNGETFSYVLALAMIPSFFFAARFDTFRRKLGWKKLMVAGLAIYAALFTMGVTTHGMSFGIVYFIILMGAEKFAYQISTVAANERIASGHRATALSVLSLIAQIPYVILMFFFANLTEPNSIHLLISGFAITAAVACLYTIFVQQKPAISKS
jgi:MFS family permease